MPPITGPAIHAFDDEEEDDDDDELDDPLLLLLLDPGELEDEALIAACVATANSDSVFVVFCR